MRRWLAAVLAVLPVAALGQVALPPTGGVLHRDFAPPASLQQAFVGAWKLTWDDPVHDECPCHGTLTIKMNPDGSLKGFWPLKGGVAVLQGPVAYDNNVWAGHFAQSDELDFPIKGNFRLETRGVGGLTGSYQRAGMSIPYRWSASRP
ncbi:hypothetical protein BH11PSE3_BH11PSE3_50140 [soil metagenome]